jgi:uncharacterized protein YbjT (DUF2867 family)
LQEKDVEPAMVTGGLGFTGRHIVSRLADAGRRVVSCNRDYAASDDPRVGLVQGELADIARMLRVMKDEGVGAIIHTAAMSHPAFARISDRDVRRERRRDLAAFVFVLGRSLQVLPVGTAYAVWTGIGAVGTLLMGVVLFGESLDLARLGCIGLVVAGIAGLKLHAG